MNIKILDTDTNKELWMAVQCAEYCNIKANTWRNYTANGRTPQPVATFNGSPLWDADEIKAWHAQRPGSPIPSKPKNNP